VRLDRIKIAREQIRLFKQSQKAEEKGPRGENREQRRLRRQHEIEQTRFQRQGEIEQEKRREQTEKDAYKRALFPPPEECGTCAEEAFTLQQLSPNEKSATYTCDYCKRSYIVRRFRPKTARQPIPRRVLDEVRRRDGGACARCGNQERLEYDHIIPVKLGGANTSRNLQLLCERCNRQKSASPPGSF